jgi:FMN phosphatase YigB (HAD superfamily)
LAKPDPACCKRAGQAGASAEEVIFIDDRSENATAAAALGLPWVHFSSPGAARAAVARYVADRN